MQDLLPKYVRKRSRDVMVSYWPEENTELVLSYDPAEDKVMIRSNESLQGKDGAGDVATMVKCCRLDWETGEIEEYFFFVNPRAPFRTTPSQAAALEEQFNMFTAAEEGHFLDLLEKV
jgi:hypothetical protein